MSADISLPEELNPYRERILKTVRSFVQLLPQEEQETQPWASRVGGLPYLPDGLPYPTGPDGRPLYLLAQVNFGEMPALPPFPGRGLLQFYIGDDSLYGLDLDNPFDQSRFRVLYHPVVEHDGSRLRSDFSFLGEPDFLPIEAGVSYPLKFELRQEPVPPADYQFEQLLGEDIFDAFGTEKWEVLNRYSRAAMASRHKIGGYAFFCQEDPRNPEDPMELLFQLGSSDAFNCMWGDMGVANFFICREALVRRDFSRVMYNWDCY